MEQDQTIRIADHGVERCLSYGDALANHRGNAYWGCAVAFRALQRAADLLSTDRSWERENLHITSAHPGPGVRDTIEYVTRCISNDRFSLSGPVTEAKCTRALEYQWQVSNGDKQVRLRLRDDFVPAEFFDILDRFEAQVETADDVQRLDEIKRILVEKIWRQPLAGLFHTTVTTRATVDCIDTT